MQPVGVMQLVDTLDAGGAEKVAVNLANCLPRDRYRSYLCTTRREGPLAQLIARDVGRIRLERPGRYSLSPIRRLARFIRANNIQVLHAHSTTLFMARAAVGLRWHVPIIWHAHYGRYAMDDRGPLSYRVATLGIGGVITVNQELADWARRRLRIPDGRVWYVPNPACAPANSNPVLDLPAAGETRIVCVANFRPEKDHLTLIRAMERLVNFAPATRLFLVGDVRDREYYQNVCYEIRSRGLEANITLLGPREDVASVLSACDIGVLSSATEGLPMALLEYGMAGLPTVATSVGQAGEVLAYGAAGLLVPPQSPDDLAAALLTLVHSRQQRIQFGQRLRAHVDHTFGPQAVLRQICPIYDQVLADCGCLPPASRWVNVPN
ncbi:MAG: glycosyltransferase [Acidobacteriia bacterium]|nr:glycosyltransferase [Terriglobia bacterium]MBV9743958.1 glycosyltransferase [Terriglobia bacterium]